jgi:hypothetical protein
MKAASLALPREARQINNYNGLANGLGERRLIDFQGISELPPKPSDCPGRSRAEARPLSNCAGNWCNLKS